MRAKLKTDVACGVQACRLPAGTFVDVICVSESGSTYVIVSPFRMTCWINEADLEFDDRIFNHAMKQSPEYILVWHHEECTASPVDEVDLIWRKRRLESIEKALSAKGVTIPTRPEWYRG